ncbi:MAG: histidine phosphatase family protein [Fimbriimonas sp.]
MVATLLALSLAQTDFTFVRHGETVANATGRYSSRTLNVLSEKGNKQVAALTERLVKEPRWDVIYVSPSPRALRTIAPYLARTGQRATVMPLLYECCTERPRQREAASFSYGAPIEVPKDVARYFVVPKGARYPAPRNYGEGLAQVTASVAEFKRLGAGKRIMLVGHSAHGGQFLKRLTGKAYHVKNAEEIALTLDLK